MPVAAQVFDPRGQVVGNPHAGRLHRPRISHPHGLRIDAWPSLPGRAATRKPSAGGISIPNCRACSTSSRAMGCSEYCSTAAASRTAAAAVKRGTVSIALDAKLGQGERARLVEDHGLQPAQVLQHGAALHEDSPADQETDAGGDRRRRGQHQGAGTGHDQHRDAPRDIAGDPERDGRRHEDHGDEIAGIAVGQPLDRGLRRLGMFHEVNDPLQRRVVAQTLDGNFQRARGYSACRRRPRRRPLFRPAATRR